MPDAASVFYSLRSPSPLFGIILMATTLFLERRRLDVYQPLNRQSRLCYSPFFLVSNPLL